MTKNMFKHSNTRPSMYQISFSILLSNWISSSHQLDVVTLNRHFAINCMYAILIQTCEHYRPHATEITGICRTCQLGLVFFLVGFLAPIPHFHILLTPLPFPTPTPHHRMVIGTHAYRRVGELSLCVTWECDGRGMRVG